MLQALIKVILDYLLEKLIKWGRGVIGFFQRKQKIEEQAKESVKPIKEAQTEKEIDDAAKDVLDNL